MNNQEEKQRKIFGKEFGAIKDYILEPWQEAYIKRIKESLINGKCKNKTILDIATGMGYVAIEMAKLGLNVIACDLTPEAIANLKKYKQKLKNLKFMVCSANKIPLKDKSVDFIVANAIIEHLEDDNGAVQEWKRVLKSGGKMLITTDLSYRYNWPFFLPIYVIHDKQIGHLRRYDLKILKRIVGLPVKKVYYTGHFLKMIWLLSTALFNPLVRFSKQIEILDAEKENNRYGASNIIVAFKKA